ncbi:hypothetical protein IQ225_18375 [Synechocystis salina LEGE 06155]|uniref:hypothetical protein n=1 Tax=Synechocystis sp. LEGE 06083 TaxID=915336 RepID=UPI001882B2EB|nr:hypothetical protein [Synechocystis sp. LEGE 06083]MBE9176792.1 hypothetical protein [Synechocystis salina LEGE 06155]MBE9195493.1 hypothetical protein [Synechocystis sp. LEGE 06083]
MPKKGELEFANFILRFGQEHVLIDFVEEIVIPAFNSGLERAYGETTHFFHDVEILNFGNLENPVLCIVGRYIKNTVVKREQVFDEENNELIKDNSSLHTSPSAVFILILNNHRLIYFSETSYAPSLLAFQTTIGKFIKEKYHHFIDELHQQNQHRRITKTELYRQYGNPSLEIVSLTSEESISEFINQYSLLKTVEIKLLTTNNELDNNEFFKQAKKIKEEANSNTTTITHNNGKDGLSKGAVTRQLESALSQGILKIKLKGKDRQGNELEGSNQNFKVKSHLTEEEISQTISGIANSGYEIFQNLVDQGIIHIGESRDNISDKIKQLWNKLNGSS